MEDKKLTNTLIKTDAASSDANHYESVPTDFVEKPLASAFLTSTSFSTNYAYSYHVFNTDFDKRRKNQEFVEKVSGGFKVKEGFTIGDIFKSIREYI